MIRAGSTLVLYDLARRAASSAVLCFALVLCACSPASSTLDGSLSTVYRTSFNRVRARLYSSELAIEYVDGENAVPVRVSIQRPIAREHGTMTDVRAGGVYAMPPSGAGTADTTGALGDGTRMPRCTGGSVTLQTFEAVAGRRVVGQFASRYDVGRVTFGLNGHFDAILEIVDNVPNDSGTFIPTPGEGGARNTSSTDAAVARDSRED